MSKVVDLTHGLPPMPEHPSRRRLVASPAEDLRRRLREMDDGWKSKVPVTRLVSRDGVYHAEHSLSANAPDRSWVDQAFWIFMGFIAVYVVGFILLPTLAAGGIGKPAITKPHYGTLSFMEPVVTPRPKTPPAPNPVSIPKLKPKLGNRLASALEQGLCEAAVQIALAYQPDDELPLLTAAEMALVEIAWHDINECVEGDEP